MTLRENIQLWTELTKETAMRLTNDRIALRKMVEQAVKSQKENG